MQQQLYARVLVMIILIGLISYNALLIRYNDSMEFGLYHQGGPPHKDVSTILRVGNDHCSTMTVFLFQDLHPI